MLQAPFYDPNKTYEENFEQGPFGAFAGGEILKSKGGPEYDFLGQKVFSLFGIPAGPLINGNFCKAAFEKGFDICVYKTVRSAAFPCHPYPNVVPVKVSGNLTFDKAQGKLAAGKNFEEPLSITNSFGVPSKTPEFWQADVRKAAAMAGEGQVLVLSFMGTVKKDQTQEEFVADYALAAKLAKETGAKILETNLSCPNIGNEGLVCYDLDMTERVCAAIRKEIGDTPLILKVGFYENDADLEKIARITHKYAQAIAAINTIQAEIVGPDGKPALPGENRARAGVCGASIKWAGIEMVKNLARARAKIGGEFKIIGVGGIMSADDFLEYRAAGADAAMSATGAMWNPFLAKEIKEKLR